jgi:Uma2 family endonuclease
LTEFRAGGYGDVMSRDAREAGRETRWTRRDYARMLEAGILHEDDPVELIEGRLLVAEPQRTPHARAIELAADALRAAFGPGWRVRVQLPIALDPDSEPEPDVSVVAGSPRDVATDHPSRPALVVEVADTSLRLDRTVKARVYARGGIAEYWIVNVIARVVEVHRQPRRRADRHPRYASVTVARSGESIRPLAAPRAVAVDDLLP